MQLIELDKSWLLAINGAHCEWLDWLMWYISQALVWIPLYAVLIGLLIWKFGWKKGLLYTIALVVAVGLSDWVSSGLIKHWVCRPRPTHEPSLDGLVHIVNGYVGGQYGFVSSHAANTMSLAVLFGLIWKKINHQGWWLMIYVAVNCYSRMYLGVHYPGDILGGLVVGTIIALAVYGLLNLGEKVQKKRVGDEGDQPCCS